MWRPMRRGELALVTVCSLFLILLLVLLSNIPDNVIIFGLLPAVLFGLTWGIPRIYFTDAQFNFGRWSSSTSYERKLNGRAYLAYLISHLELKPEYFADYETVHDLPLPNVLLGITRPRKFSDLLLLRYRIKSLFLLFIAFVIIIGVAYGAPMLLAGPLNLAPSQNLTPLSTSNLLTLTGLQLAYFIGSFVVANGYRKLRNTKEQAQILRNILIVYRKRQSESWISENHPWMSPSLLAVLSAADERYEQLIAAREYELASAIADELECFDVMPNDPIQPALPDIDPKRLRK